MGRGLIFKSDESSWWCRGEGIRLRGASGSLHQGCDEKNIIAVLLKANVLINTWVKLTE
jgi:hypothetical protein